MPGRFTDLDVRDPHLIGQAVRDSLPLSEKTSITDASAMEWAPLEGRFPAKWSVSPGSDIAAAYRNGERRLIPNGSDTLAERR
jgi:hypothetical protein